MANLRTNNLSGEGGRNAYNGSVFFDGTENRLDVAHSTDFDIADSNPELVQSFTADIIQWKNGRKVSDELWSR